jgi:phage-related protein
MKPVRFIGSAKDELSAFPKSARQRYRDARDLARGANRG